VAAADMEDYDFVGFIVFDEIECQTFPPKLFRLSFSTSPISLGLHFLSPFQCDQIESFFNNKFPVF
jgi:hypothetical protein